MANRKRTPYGGVEAIVHALVIETLAFLVAYTLAKAAGWVD